MAAKQLLIVGLGNPGREYEGTRHNIGFTVLDALASLHHAPVTRRAVRATASEIHFPDATVHLIKPTTYMNLSGEAVIAYIRQRTIVPADIMVVADDINLPLGKIRIRPGGSDGGHNGFKSITAHLHTKDYPRLRIGVDAPADRAQQIDFVLGKFSPTEREPVEDAVARAVAALETWAQAGLQAAMNKFN